jgi:hypothetical protein
MLRGIVWLPPKQNQKPMKLKEKISWLLGRVQRSLFPHLNECLAIWRGLGVTQGRETLQEFVVGDGAEFYAILPL